MGLSLGWARSGSLQRAAPMHGIPRAPGFYLRVQDGFQKRDGIASRTQDLGFGDSFLASGGLCSRLL